jgi:signal transduction histidine kinase
MPTGMTAEKVVVVDDNAINRKLLRVILETEGYAVLEAADGAEALVLMEGERVLGVISDVLMPKMDGFRFCREIRTSRKFRALPFILYTSTHDSSTDRQLAKSVGVDDFIVRPAPAPVIIGALRDAIEKVRETEPEVAPPDETYVLQHYSDALVEKLTAKNRELEDALKDLQAAHDEILQLNSGLEARVQQRTAELQAANRELESFSYSVSHDLRTPLRHIAGYSELLKESAGSALDPESVRYVDAIIEAARRMDKLIDDLLEFSRIVRTAMHRTTVSLDTLVRETLKDLQADMEGRNILWQIDPLPAVQGDPRLLRLVVTNLISNALKFTRTRPAPSIVIGADRNENSETVTFVRDNGVGFESEYADKLFNVFQRLHSAREFEGTGIGLANVRRIIERHGGRVWAEGSLDHGATFYFSLPNLQS